MVKKTLSEASLNPVAFLVARPMAKAAWRIVPDLEAGGSTGIFMGTYDGFAKIVPYIYPLVMTNIAMV